MRKTKIVCTIGPSSESEEMLKRLFKAGVNVCRLNFSHGSYENHQIKIDRIKKVREALNLPVAIMLDTKGPEIRIGKFETGSEHIIQGQKFVLTSREVMGTSDICSVNYQNIAKEVECGSRVLINDGLLEFKVSSIINETDIECIAVNSGVISNNKGVNIPGLETNMPYISDKDLADIEFGIKNDCDFIAASFTRSADDIAKIRNILKSHNSSISIIAKIENQLGLDNIREILEAADGIMIARGDLGVEIAPEKIPLAQKMLIREAARIGKPVITATQMLESMTNFPQPTRAEVTDVANAIFDGTSAVMLSGETAVGKYPAEAVEMMNSIALAAENSIDYKRLFEENFSIHELTTTNALAKATCSTALDLKAAAIITATSSGITPRAISKFKPLIPIIAVTDSKAVMRKLSLDWGVYSILANKFKTTDNMFEICGRTAKKAGYLKTGDTAVLTAGIPIGKAGSTNLLKVEIID